MSRQLIKSYSTQPDNVEAVEITEETREAAARWCGGTSVEGQVVVPTMDGPTLVEVGSYLVRRKSDGRFFGMEAPDFEAKYKYSHTRTVEMPGEQLK